MKNGNSRASPIYTINWNSAYLPNWIAARTRILNGTGTGILGVVGDSTSVGTGGSSPRMEQSWPYKLGDLLTTAGLATSTDSFFGSSNVAGGWDPTSDSRITMGANWEGSSTDAVGGQILANVLDTSLLTFTPIASVDTFEVFLPTAPSFGVTSVQIDAGTPQTINQAASAAWVKNTFSTTLGAHTINISRVSGGTLVAGVKAYNSATKQLYIENWGSGGATAQFPVGTNFSIPYGGVQSLSAVAGDLTMIQMTTNDIVGQTSLSTYKTAYTAMIVAAQAKGDVVLVTGIPPSFSNQPLVNQTPYLQVNYDLATLYNCPLLDLYSRWVTYNSATANGWTDGDGLHGSSAGYLNEAQWISNLLMTV